MGFQVEFERDARAEFNQTDSSLHSERERRLLSGGHSTLQFLDPVQDYGDLRDKFFARLYHQKALAIRRHVVSPSGKRELAPQIPAFKEHPGFLRLLTRRNLAVAIFSD